MGVRRILIQALVLFRLDYGNSLYLGAPKTAMRKLQSTQNCAARLLLGIPKTQSAKSPVKTLHCCQFWKSKIFLFSYGGRARQLTAPSSPSTAPKRCLSSANLNLAIVPKIKRVRSGGRFFSYNVARLWNTLPPHIRSESHHLPFRKLLKTWTTLRYIISQSLPPSPV